MFFRFLPRQFLLVFQKKQGSLENIVALVNETEVFVAFPQVVGDGGLEDKFQVVEGGGQLLIVLGLYLLAFALCKDGVGELGGNFKVGGIVVERRVCSLMRL